jgi:hypothetical protein
MNRIHFAPLRILLVENDSLFAALVRALGLNTRPARRMRGVAVRVETGDVLLCAGILAR